MTPAPTTPQVMTDPLAPLRKYYNAGIWSADCTEQLFEVAAEFQAQVSHHRTRAEQAEAAQKLDRLIESERDMWMARAEAAEARVRELESNQRTAVDLVTKLQFGFQFRRCPLCAGYGAGPDGKAQGEADHVHTDDCPVGVFLRSVSPSPRAEKKE